MEDTKKTIGTNAAEPPEPADAPQMTKLGEDIGEPRVSQPTDSPAPADKKEAPGPVAPTEANKTSKYQVPLKITQQTWLIAATVLLGLVALFIFGRTTGRNKAVGEIQEERTVESLTPDSLVAKCGQPAEDVTKDLYPMIKRTMSYKSSGKETSTLQFSRTSEEKSEWVFLSMSDENGVTYGTAATQIAAMPCLRK